MFRFKKKPKPNPPLASDVLLLLERLCNATKGGFRDDPNAPEEDFCATSLVLSPEARERIPRHLGLRYDPATAKQHAPGTYWEITWDRADVPLVEKLAEQGVRTYIWSDVNDRTKPDCVHVDVDAEGLDMSIIIKDGAVHLYDFQRM